ncbi:MAG TPA: ATP-binding protein [Blastocatellia bacterium]
MTGRNRSPFLRYGASVLAFGTAWLLAHLLWPLIDPASPQLFFAAVMVAAFYGGLGPGLLATALSTVAIDVFFTPPFNSLEFTLSNVVRAGVFILVAVIISSLNATRMKLMDDLSERDQEREELLAQISRINDELRRQMDDLSEKNRERERLLAQISGFNDELRSQVEAAKRELFESNQALLRMQQQMICSERLAVAGQMAASLAHEIGTPLNAISGHLQLLARDHPQHYETQRRVQVIAKQLEFIVGIVRRLLKWSHKKQFHFRPANLNMMMRDLLTLVSPALEQRGIAVSTDFTLDLPPVFVDRDALNQVFLNLINNSLDAMPDGGLLEISTGIDRDGGMVELIFRDSGMGIDSASIERIFEPMWTTKPWGSGFGLPIAREIIIEHNGQIEAVCEQRQGATFVVRLPLNGANAMSEVRKEAMTNVA